MHIHNTCSDLEFTMPWFKYICNRNPIPIAYPIFISTYWTAGQSQVQTPTPLGMHNCTTQTIHCFPSTCRRSKTMIALVLVKRYWSFQKSNIISRQKYNAFKYKIISMVRLWKKKKKIGIRFILIKL